MPVTYHEIHSENILNTFWKVRQIGGHYGTMDNFKDILKLELTQRIQATPDQT